MRLQPRSAAILALLLSAAGISLLVLFSENVRGVSVAEALVLEENTLVRVSGTAANVTSGKFLLCNSLCISVRHGEMAAAKLLAEGKRVEAEGRVKEYRGARYIEAETLDVGQ